MIRPLLHLDLGLASLKKYNEKNTKCVKISNEFSLLTPHEGKPYYLLKWGVEERKDTDCLKKLIKTIDSLD